MKNIYSHFLVLLCAPLLLAACASQPKQANQQELLEAQEKSSYEQFTSRADYKKTYELYKNDALLSKPATSKRVVVNLGDQRAQYLVNGKVALDFPVCTGVRAHPTPTGTFSISEKKVAHRSNLYGNYSLAQAEKAKEEGTFVGTSMPYWQRLTGCGIGLHVGKVRRHPASHGCIRVPREIGSLLFAKTNIGTRVDVIRYKGDVPVLRMPPSKPKVAIAKPAKLVAPKSEDEKIDAKAGEGAQTGQVLTPVTPALSIEPKKTEEVKLPPTPQAAKDLATPPVTPPATQEPTPAPSPSPAPAPAPAPALKISPAL